MPDSLEDFLGIKQDNKFIDITNSSLACQECDEVVNSGKLDETEMILYYLCINGHESRIKI